MAIITLANNRDRYSWDGRTICNTLNINDRWSFDGKDLVNMSNPMKRYIWDGKTLSAYAGNHNNDIRWDGRYLSESACPSNQYDLVKGNDVYRNGTVATSDSKNIHPVAWIVAIGLVH